MESPDILKYCSSIPLQLDQRSVRRTYSRAGKETEERNSRISSEMFMLTEASPAHGQNDVIVLPPSIPLLLEENTFWTVLNVSCHAQTIE